RAVAIRLAKQGADVAVIGRNVDRGQEAVKEMDAASNEGKHFFVKGDAMLLKGVDQSAQEAAEALGNRRLDYLIMCQTIATTQGRSLTEEKLDQKLVMHIYSRIRYIQRFLPLLKATAKLDDGKADPRVLSVLSAGVHKPYNDYKQDPGLEQNYTLANAAN